MLKVARTIADLASADSLNSSHIAEAVHYRALDRRISVPARSGAPVEYVAKVHKIMYIGFLCTELHARPFPQNWVN